MPAAYTGPLWPLVVYFAAIIVIVVGMIGLSYVLGEHHRGEARGRPYESGIVSTGTGRSPINIKFYLVAMFFVIFDLESVFIIAWAVAVRELSWTGYVEVLVFIGILVATLAYLWRLGALDWGTLRRRRPPPGSPFGTVVAVAKGDSPRRDGGSGERP
ncbi:MAG: NADH-quinone oxidoreductase subunit A [Bacteroidetes bacterium]|nr:NADH-quinone oxidoreductase subunit A [Bacteroidota bacterium]MCL5026870.1 NADH-quinone oxidoreductase subunit A [Chloroflexota bacterium]